MRTNVQKTILGKQVRNFQFYKMVTWRSGREEVLTRGFVWLEDGNSIRIEGSKFIIYRSHFPNQRGIMGKSLRAYKQIKRMIAIWFRNYRKLSQNQYLAAS
ncbi:hypothetical protein CLU96_1280 [Chryseobacterium sp. 52]|uniref:hypothetical protein n=1 Tax=Chryseobacterium sp. 52 TaxID=2035213 RepID=UPI000C1763EB|nr:hypothetical protein [Chryseobacterium sp. 52]PIF44336.1 hypothetical protein CLU96_1280 [Chryseobacterium sp. 52]